ncbi:hypothetical protein HX049_06010 [Myroides odoratimimus]|uniref:hypothetical protein n=1 Tax=Myroides odoratimimus TaxID=76832 RepID=UPI002575EA70|nr:hypothetical protein [Myroides odoratimimus]MDM1396726.1 hypothetical protein [Myroides odoratimimus]
MNKHIILMAVMAIMTVGCKENKANTPTESTSIKSSTTKTNDDNGTMAIPMHGTGENSSSATNGSFKMDESMKKNIQEQKAQE